MRFSILVAVCLAGLALSAGSARGQDPYWLDEMLQVRGIYDGGDYTISRFGDSISVSMAYFVPLQYGHSNTTPDDATALSWIQSWVSSACWDWQVQYSLHGCDGGTTSSWPFSSASGWPGAQAGETKLEYWLRNDDPAVAVIMWGTNDLTQGLTPQQYESNIEAVVQVCKDNGTIPILTTAPPRHNYDNGTAANQQRAADFANAARSVATTMEVPLIEYHDECTTRNPHNPPTSSWDGADPMWSGYSGYEVPTSISGDGVHPSNYSGGQQNFSQTGLDTNGFNLRNWMTLHACYDVYDLVIKDNPPQPPPPDEPTLEHELKWLGDGKYGITFTVCGNDNEYKSFFVNLTFEGANGGEIQQVLAFGSGSVDSDDLAALYDPVPEANYDMDLDSYFLQPFPDNAMDISEGANSYHIEAGTGGASDYLDVGLGYIVTTGDLYCYGVVSRSMENHNILLTAEMPVPGDANLDDVVDGADYTAWADHYSQTDVGWEEADFNGDDVVDGADYTVWADFYGQTGSSPAPEPTTAALMALGLVALLRRRRR